MTMHVRSLGLPEPVIWTPPAGSEPAGRLSAAGMCAALLLAALGLTIGIVSGYIFALTIGWAALC